MRSGVRSSRSIESTVEIASRICVTDEIVFEGFESEGVSMAGRVYGKEW